MQHFQMQTLSFDSPYVAAPQPVMMYTANGLGSARQANASASTPFSQQLLLTANVTFSSPNLACKPSK